ncbi:hypothetical protein DKP78_21895, partial [Enterococcus faecium]
MQTQQTSTTGSTMHNIKEKVKHPFTHDTDTNVTYDTRQQKKLAVKDPSLTSGTSGIAVPQSSSVGSGGMLNQPTTQTHVGRE